MKQLRQLILSLLCIAGLASSAWAESNDLHPVKGQPLAQDFELIDINDETHRLSDYRGKIVIVNFWATWCPPCRFELPSMERMWQVLRKEDVVMLGINVGEDADTIFTFTSDYPVNFPLLMDRDSSVTKGYKVLGIPTSFIIDPRGRIVYRAVGTREWDEKQLTKKILELKQNESRKKK
jgi:peroxiredoxin